MKIESGFHFVRSVEKGSMSIFHFTEINAFEVFVKFEVYFEVEYDPLFNIFLLIILGGIFFFSVKYLLTNKYHQLMRKWPNLDI